MRSIYQGKAELVLPQFPDACFDALVCDPPSSIKFMGTEWDSNKGGRTQWVAWLSGILREAMRTLKPGGHAFIWALPRTSHWTMCAIEDAGFEIRDTIHHIFACVSEDTEILTEDGWTQYQKCVAGSRALCYNKDDSTFGWEPIEEVLVYDHSDTAYHIHSDHTDQLVTRNHRCLVERGGGYVFKEAQNLERNEYIPVLENLPYLLESIPVHGQGRSRKEGDLLSALQREVLPTPQRSQQGARQHQVPPTSYKILHTLRAAFSVRNTLSSIPQTDVFPYMREQADRRQTQEGYTPHSNLLALSEGVSSQKQPINKKGTVLLSSPRSSISGATTHFLAKNESDWSKGKIGMDREQSTILSPKNERGEQPVVAWRSNPQAPQRELQRGCLCEMPFDTLCHGDAERIHHGTPSHRVSDNRALTNTQGGCASPQSRSLRQSHREPATVCQQLRPQEVRALWHPTPDLATVTPVHYEGIVWCVRVPSGAFVARRNGKVFVTGNSGMPKGQNTSKAINHVAGADLAAQWSGWNSTIKPAVEYWVLARKPLAESTIAKQVLATGTGAINIDACRNDAQGEKLHVGSGKLWSQYRDGTLERASPLINATGGRWPANLVLSHSPECIPLDRVAPAEDRRKVSSGKGFCTTKYSGSVGEGESTIIAGVRDYGDGKDAPAWQCTPECPIALLNAQSVTLTSGKSDGFDGPYKADVYGKYARNMIRPETIYGDTGGASRYFTTLPYEAPFIYLPKSSPADRTMNKQVENGHPTCKSTALMAWLCKLITPPGGTILDCFMGSGSTLVAASRLGFSWVGIDESPEYCAIARARLATLGIDVDVNAQGELAPVVTAPLQLRIRYHVGSIFEVDAQVLVNPVNCQGVMNKGLAKQFKERYPDMVAAYREDCRTRKLAIGHPRLYKGSTPWILNLPTKDAWTAPSRLSYIEQSLQYIADHYTEAGITSLAFPKLGCGEGGLSWDEVGPLMVRYLSARSMDVTICVGENDTQYQEGDTP